MSQPLHAPFSERSPEAAEPIFDPSDRVTHPPSAIQRQLEGEFGDDMEMISLHLFLSMGLAARWGRISHIHRQDNDKLLDVPIQNDYIAMLRGVQAAGRRLHSDNLPAISPYDSIYEELFSASPTESHQDFQDLIEEIILVKERIFNNPGIATWPTDRRAVHLFDTMVRRAADERFKRNTMPFFESRSPIPLDRLNREIILNYTDDSYWHDELDEELVVASHPAARTQGKEDEELVVASHSSSHVPTKEEERAAFLRRFRGPVEFCRWVSEQHEVISGRT